MEEIYDQFPVNILETGGKISREPFGFIVHTIKIWEKQNCIINQRIDGVIKGTITNQKMHIELRNIDYNQYISNNLDSQKSL